MAGSGCTQCGAGYKRLADCSSKLGSQCTPCQSGQYSDRADVSTHCTKCRTQCSKTYETVTQSCKSTSDIVCECKQGYFLESNSDLACTSHTRCPPGHGASVAGTPTTNTECAKWPNGLVGVRDSSTEECMPLTDCNQLGGLKFTGDTTRDNECYSKVAGLSPLYIGCITAGVLVILFLIIVTIYLNRRRNSFLTSASGKLTSIINRNKHSPTESTTPQNNLGGSLNIQPSQNMMSQNSTINNISLYQSSQGLTPQTSRISSAHDFNRLDEEKFMNKTVIVDVKHGARKDNPSHSRGPLFHMSDDSLSSLDSMEAVISQPLLNNPPPIYGEVVQD